MNLPYLRFRMGLQRYAVPLSRVRELYPDTTRLLLTGHSDLEDAANAINHGNIFRYVQSALLGCI